MIRLHFTTLRNDLYCGEWGVKLYSLTCTTNPRAPHLVAHLPSAHQLQRRQVHSMAWQRDHSVTQNAREYITIKWNYSHYRYAT